MCSNDVGFGGLISHHIRFSSCSEAKYLKARLISRPSLREEKARTFLLTSVVYDRTNRSVAESYSDSLIKHNSGVEGLVWLAILQSLKTPPKTCVQIQSNSTFEIYIRRMPNRMIKYSRHSVYCKSRIVF
jgi:hypothetical protein